MVELLLINFGVGMLASILVGIRVLKLWVAYFLVTLDRERREMCAAGWLSPGALQRVALCPFAFPTLLAARPGAGLPALYFNRAGSTGGGRATGGGPKTI